MASRISKTYSEAMQEVVAKYRGVGQPWPATSRQIARWAIRNGEWIPHENGVVQQCARDIARALREERYRDPQGRKVRTKHAASLSDDGLGGVDADGSPHRQETFWTDIRTGKWQHLARAFQQRRSQILGDCKQLKTDVESYNENHFESKTIQMVFDFTEDLAEMDQPDEYRPGPGDGDDIT